MKKGIVVFLHNFTIMKVNDGQIATKLHQIILNISKTIVRTKVLLNIYVHIFKMCVCVTDVNVKCHIWLLFLATV